MTDYNKSVNFAVKDTLTSGDPNKIVSGAEIDTEFNNISSASTTKIDKVPAAGTGNLAQFTATGAIADSGKNSSDFADALDTESRFSILETDIDTKADKVVSGTENNFVSLDSSGNMQDSGENVSTIFPTGIVTPFAGTSAPSGWLLCGGQEVSRTTYSNLFSAIGTTFGNGNGSTTFNVPDLRDRFPLGDRDQGQSDASRVDNFNTALGDSGGADEHQLTESEMPSHNHTYSPGRANNDSNGCGGLVGASGVSGCTKTSNNSGGDQAHNNMPPFLALNYIIKT